MFYYVFVGLLLIGLLSLYLYHSKFIKKVHFNEIKFLLIFLLLLFAVDWISVVGIFQSGQTNSLPQFLKAIFQSTWLKIFLALFLLYSAINRHEACERYLKIFIIMVLFSCFYQFAYLFFKISYDINIDDIIWPILTFGTYDPPDFSRGIGDKAFTFYRHGGLAINPNLHVAQITCMVPVVYHNAQKGQKWLYLVLFVFVVSMLFTLSRSGLLALLLLLILIPVIFRGTYRHLMILVFLIPAILCILAFAVDQYLNLGFIEGLFTLTMQRSSGLKYSETLRGQLLIVGLDLWSKYPFFGVGVNNSPVVMAEYDAAKEAGTNLHNYWLQQIVEKGIFALVVVVYYAYLIFNSRRLKNYYGECLIVILVVLSIICLTNNSLAHPFIQVYFVILYCAALKSFNYKK